MYLGTPPRPGGRSRSRIRVDATPKPGGNPASVTAPKAGSPGAPQGVPAESSPSKGIVSNFDKQVLGNPQGASTPKTRVDTPPVRRDRSQSRARSPDSLSSVGDLSRSLERVFQGLAATLRQPLLPTIEPEMFEGNLLDFPKWEMQIEDCLGELDTNSYKKLQILSKYLSGEAARSIQALLAVPSPSCYEKARQILKKRFGNPLDVAEAFRNQLNNWPNLEEGDGPALRNFSDFLDQVYVAMETLPSLNILNDGYENRALALKLPFTTANQWARKIAHLREEGKYPSLGEFAEFVATEARVLCDPLSQTLNAKRRRNVPPPRVVHQATTEKRTECTKCGSSEHRTRDCSELGDLTRVSLREYVKEKNLCFKCLGTQHRARDCRSAVSCKLCDNKHVTAWHGKDYSPRKGVTCNKVRKHSEPPSSLTAMIVPVYISASGSPDTETLTYALLDTQSDACFGTSEALSNLRTDRTKVQLKVSTITNEAKTLNSVSHEGLRVRGLNSKTWVILPQVYERDSIPANRSHIPTAESIRHQPHLRSLRDKLPPLQNVEVGLLIGYNCPEAIAPLVTLVGKGAKPYGVQTALGWAVVGQAGKSADVESVLALGAWTAEMDQFVLGSGGRKPSPDPEPVCEVWQSARAPSSPGQLHHRPGGTGQIHCHMIRAAPIEGRAMRSPPNDPWPSVSNVAPVTDTRPQEGSKLHRKMPRGVSKKPSKCTKCKSNHRPRECPELINLTRGELYEFIKNNNLCFNCLGGGHRARDCRSALHCESCSSKHVTAWHNKGRVHRCTGTKQQRPNSFKERPWSVGRDSEKLGTREGNHGRAWNRAAETPHEELVGVQCSGFTGNQWCV